MGEPKAVQAERSRAGRMKKIREIVWRSVLQTPDGRRFCYELLERGHIFMTSFRGDALLTAFAEGERNFALRLNEDMVSSDGAGYGLMLKEAAARKEVPNDDEPSSE